MKKSCCICEKSVEVKYTVEIEGYSRKTKDKRCAVFCIAGPPSFFYRGAMDLKLGYVIAGGARLKKYEDYPLVASHFSEVAPCFQLCETKNNKKLENYVKRLESEKLEKEKVAKEKNCRIKIKKKEQEKIRKEKEKVKEEAAQRRKEYVALRKRRKSQKKYRLKKKMEKIELLAKEIKQFEEENTINNRFEIMDV